MSKDLTKKAVEMLLKGATLLSDPCPYCKGVRIIKDGSALCVNCGREDREQKLSQDVKSGSDTMFENLDQKLKDLTEELEREKDHEKQQKILKSINDIIMIKEKPKKF